TPRSFEASALTRTDIRDLMSRIAVKEKPELTERFKKYKDNMSELIVRLRDGRTLRKQTSYPAGHPKNPATKAVIHSKLAALIEPHVGAANLERLIDRVEHLEEWRDVSEVFTAYEAVAR